MNSNFISKTKQKGIGLIEILISMFIGLFIMAGVVQMFSTTSQNSVANAGSSRIQENIRYAFSRMVDDVSKTGNLGCLSSSVFGDLENSFLNMLANNTGLNQLYDYGTIAGGYENATNATPPAGSVVAGTDTFLIRYASNVDKIVVNSATDTSFVLDTTDTGYQTLEQYKVVLVSNCSDAALFMITNDPTTSAGVIEHTAGVVAPSGGLNGGQSNVIGTNTIVRSKDIGDGSIEYSLASDSETYMYVGDTGSYQYYIGTSAAAADRGEACNSATAEQNCALFRRANSINEEILEGVHNMEIEYGWTDEDGTLSFANASLVANDNWPLVDRVKVTLSFNSIENSASSAAGNNLDELLIKSATRTIYLPNQI